MILTGTAYHTKLELALTISPFANIFLTNGTTRGITRQQKKPSWCPMPDTKWSCKTLKNTTRDDLRRSAKPLFTGSNPVVASIPFKDSRNKRKNAGCHFLWQPAYFMPIPCLMIKQAPPLRSRLCYGTRSASLIISAAQRAAFPTTSGQ